MSQIEVIHADENRTKFSDIELGAFFTPKSGPKAGALFLKIADDTAWDVVDKHEEKSPKGNLSSSTFSNPLCVVYKDVKIEVSL